MLEAAGTLQYILGRDLGNLRSVPTPAQTCPEFLQRGGVKHTLTCDLRNNHSVLSHLRVLPDDSRGGTLHIPFVETSHLSTHLRNHRVGVSKLRRRKLLFQGAVGVLA